MTNLSGFEVPTDAELMGYDPDVETESGEPLEAQEQTPETEEAAEPSQPEGEKAKQAQEPEQQETKTEPEEEKPEAKQESEEEAERKTVPLEALHEARAQAKEWREEAKQYRDELQALRRTVEDLQRTAKEPKPESEKQPEDTFKVLNPDEFKTLREEDPDAAMDYLFELREWEHRQSEKRQRELTERERQTQRKTMAEQVWARIHEAIPVTVAEEEARLKYRDAVLGTLKQHGITGDMLEIISDPAAMISLPGKYDEAVPLGNGALTVWKLLDSLHKTSSGMPDMDKIRAELKEELRTEVEKEVFQKFKDTATGNESQHRDIAGAPGSGEIKEKDLTDPGVSLTAAQIAKLTPQQKKEYFGGD